MFSDIGANLTDEMYQGIYHGSKKHEADLSHVLKRAWEAGLSKMIITGTSLSDSKAAVELAKTNGKFKDSIRIEEYVKIRGSKSCLMVSKH